MTGPHNKRFAQFNFVVDFGTGSTGTHEAGFHEVSGIDNVRKITGLNKSTNVTLKRGVIGSLEFDKWLSDIREGNQNALRDVTVSLQNEDHTAVVQTWKLRRARIIKHTSGPMNAKGNDVAMEELVISCERLDVE